MSIVRTWKKKQTVTKKTILCIHHVKKFQGNIFDGHNEYYHETPDNQSLNVNRA